MKHPSDAAQETINNLKGLGLEIGLTDESWALTYDHFAAAERAKIVAWMKRALKIYRPMVLSYSAISHIL